MIPNERKTDVNPSDLEFRTLPEWRVDEVMVEMDEAKRKRLTAELKRRMDEGENLFYAEIPREGAPGDTVGVGSWCVRSWPRQEGPDESSGLVEISFIHVRPEYRGKGMGKAILENAIVQAADLFEGTEYPLRKVYALVSSGNKKGMEAYRRWGFDEEAVLNRHFSDEFDTVVMSTRMENV